MARLFKSNSSVNSRTSVPPDIINEDDHTIEETDLPDFQKWNIPKVETKSIYRTSWTENTFCSQCRVRIVEKTYSTSKTHEKCSLFSKRNINDFLAKNSIIYILALFKLLLNLLLEKVLMLLFSSV